MAVLSFSSLPLGFRFRPTDEELVDYYLRLKINGNDNDVRVIREIDVCKWEPWDLPVIPTRDPEWFFFCPLDRKYPNGHRSNRATIAGYWKATGKDRKIKSGVSLIGMKKTLVFHTGRAPKGKRTNWVMHEYRATQNELDGTNPGQSAFVLCRLFKKQDESIEDSNCDGVEPTVSSPTASNLSPEEMQSEGALVQESPVLNEKRPTKEECCLAENLNGTDSDCLALVECHKNGYDAEDKVLDVTAKEVDLQLEEDLDLFYDPVLEPLDCKIFSPLHSQMQMELGSSSMFSVTNDLSSVYSEVQFQYGTNEPDTSTSDFLNSVLNNTDEYFCGETIKNSAIEGENPKDTVFLEGGESCGGSYAKESFALVETTPGDYQTLTSEYDVDEGTKNLVLLRNNPYKRDAISSGSGVEPFCNMIDNLEGLTSDTNETGRGDAGIGIRTRPRQPQNDPCIENSLSQGTAPRRLYLQLNLAEPDHSIKKSRDWSGPDYNEPRFVLQMGNITEEHSSAGDSNAATSTMDEPQKTYPVGSREDSKFTQELSAGMRPKFWEQSKKSTSEKVPPVLKKIYNSETNWSFVISRVIVLVVLVFIASVGIWRLLEF